ncbi:BnaA01g24330D [Brassica napus]|uniref:Uncharacterized protein n=2 Tax=Brassica TaxID=3705 RepID=M4E4T3_BRACM|nr:unnamed protein product [Brassica napus]CDY34216.1 BnaA01g24330D [Brassica napus]
MNRGGLREDNVEVGQAYVGEPWLHPRQRAFGEAAPGKDLEGSEIQEKSPDFGKNELRCDSDADESDADDGGEEEVERRIHRLRQYGALFADVSATVLVQRASSDL